MSFLIETRSFLIETRSFLIETRSFLIETRSFLIETRSNFLQGVDLLRFNPYTYLNFLHGHFIAKQSDIQRCDTSHQ